MRLAFEVWEERARLGFHCDVVGGGRGLPKPLLCVSLNVRANPRNVAILWPPGESKLDAIRRGDRPALETEPHSTSLSSSSHT